jgi:hypothetical protein
MYTTNIKVSYLHKKNSNWLMTSWSDPSSIHRARICTRIPFTDSGGMHSHASYWFYANAVHSRDLLLVFSASLVLQNPKLSFPLEGGGGVYSFHIVTIYPFSAVGSDRCLNYVQVTVVRNFPMIQQSSRQKTGAQCHRQKFLACANSKHDKIFKLMSSLPKMQHRNNSVCLICYSLSKTNS